jgi:hypothetical protein
MVRGEGLWGRGSLGTESGEAAGAPVAVRLEPG